MSADRPHIAPARTTWPERIVRRDLLSVFYHTVSNHGLPHIEHLYAFKTPMAFEQDLVHLRERYRLVDDGEITHARTAGRELPPRSMTLTFDDGFTECFSVVRPLLKKYEAPCTFFLTTDAVDNRMLMHRNKVSLCLDRLHRASDDEKPGLEKQCRVCLGIPTNGRASIEQALENLRFPERETIDRLCESLSVDVAKFLRESQPYMTTQQVRQLHADGFTIGAHTRTHAELWLLDDRREVEREIVESCAFVRDLTGQEVVPFAFPFNGLWCKRDVLADIRARHEFIGLIYDTNNLMVDRDFVVNRVWCDAPDAAHPERSNVADQLRRAYRLEPLRNLRRRLRRPGS